MAPILNPPSTKSVCPVTQEASSEHRKLMAFAMSSGAQAQNMDKLIADAKAEGMLTTIALPHDWCGYGELIASFHRVAGTIAARSSSSARRAARLTPPGFAR